MKKFLLLVIASILLPMAINAKSEKRGISENQFQFLAQMEALSPGVSWYYNWGNAEGKQVDGQEWMEFIPMCWSQHYNADNIREYCKNHPETRYLLGFNEPNFKAQANMTPAEAAEAWPAVQALAKELNLQLVAPVLNYSPDAPYNDPLKWMDEFVALVGKDAFDYTAIHNYGGIGVMIDLANKFHDRYGKEVWVTEFCFWPGEAGAVSPENQISSMIESIEWLEKTEWIHKYSWFKAIGDSSSDKGPNYGLLISGKGEEPRELSEQGKVYLYMPDFDASVYHELGEEYAASDFISQSGILLGTTADPAALSPIEITRFSAGASADYQFDVTAAGEYNLTLKVTGYGAPERFDPNIGVYKVDSEGNDGEELCAKTFTLPGDETTYTTVSFPIKLDSGKQVLRLKDTNAYRPSGIHISTIALVSAAGINEISAVDLNKPVNVYNLQGVCVLKNVMPAEVKANLPKGIYLIGGKKVAIQ